MARTRIKKFQISDLFSELQSSRSPTTDYEWPAAGRFPVNAAGSTVSKTVLSELRDSDSPLVIAGYASLDHVIGLIARCRDDAIVRVVFGNEPIPTRREQFVVGRRSFPEEVEHYWLARGISLRRSAQLIACIEALSKGRVQARYVSDREQVLHAKIYATELSVTLGSSNFTRAGLERNLEANARFTLKKEPKRYRELIRIADNYSSMGTDYTDALKALIQSLLRFVEWQEALARACAELLEGEWANEYIGRALLPEEVNLWPSQRQGIAQALYVLSRQGSVLVADATGSGKTRLGTHLIRAVQDQIAGSGRLRRGRTVMACPPAVRENWDTEARLVDTPIETVSHGKLSWVKEGRNGDLADSLRRGQVLCVARGAADEYSGGTAREEGDGRVSDRLTDCYGAFWQGRDLAGALHCFLFSPERSRPGRRGGFASTGARSVDQTGPCHHLQRAASQETLVVVSGLLPSLANAPVLRSGCAGRSCRTNSGTVQRSRISCGSRPSPFLSSEGCVINRDLQPIAA